MTFRFEHEAVIVGSRAQCWAAFGDESAGRSEWWHPYVHQVARPGASEGTVGFTADLEANDRGFPARFGTVRWSERVVSADPGVRLVSEAYAGDLRGRHEWQFEAVDETHTRVRVRFVGDYHGWLLRLITRVVDVEGEWHRVMSEGTSRMERYIAHKEAALRRPVHAADL